MWRTSGSGATALRLPRAQIMAIDRIVDDQNAIGRRIHYTQYKPVSQWEERDSIFITHPPHKE